MRLFVGVRPPGPVLDQVGELVAQLQGSLDRRSVGALRWASRDQWHLTLRFLGEVDDPEPVVTALDRAPIAPARAALGPATKVLGSQVVCVPAAGLEVLAAGVVAATASFGRPPGNRPFHGHLTVARLRGRPRRSRTLKHHDLDGAAIEARWRVDEVVLVRSHLGSGGSRYENLHVRRLT
ncbi:MAG: RNA 2',3'-cyclic phosphodiesterase [Acidimicrobiales bacterium]